MLTKERMKDYFDGDPAYFWNGVDTSDHVEILIDYIYIVKDMLFYSAKNEENAEWKKRAEAANVTLTDLVREINILWDDKEGDDEEDE